MLFFPIPTFLLLCHNQHGAQSVEKHEGYLLSLLTDTMMFKQALLALREVSMRLSKRFSEYGTTFTDKADPDIETSSRSCQKLADFMEGFARTLAACVCFHWLFFFFFFFLTRFQMLDGDA